MSSKLLTKLECKSCGEELDIYHVGELLLPWKCTNCGEKTVFKKDDIFTIKKRKI